MSKDPTTVYRMPWEARRDGYVAGRRRSRVHANPYASGTVQFQAWHDGWIAQRAARRKDLVGGLIGFIVMLPALCSFFAGGLILLSQCVDWLARAVWPARVVHDGLNWWVGRKVPLDHLMTQYLGVNKIIQAILELPLPLWLMVIQPIAWITLGVHVFGFLIRFVDDERPADGRARMHRT